MVLVLATSASALLAGSPAGAAHAVSCDAVWVPPEDFRDRLEAKREGADDSTALVRVMQAAGARPAALDLARRLGEDAGYLGECTSHGPLVTGSLHFPLRASNSSESCAIDARGRLVRFTGPDAIPVEELAKSSTYRELARRDRALEAYPPLEPVETQRRGAAFEVILTYPLRTCPSCPARGAARVAFLFDRDGIHAGRRLLTVTGRAR